MKKDNDIQIRLVSAAETKFSIRTDFDAKNVNMEETRINLLHKSRVLSDEELEVEAIAKYSYGDETILESGCRLAFQVKGLEKFVVKKEDGRTDVPQIMPYVMDVAIGAIRGMLMTKTSGTPLANFPLPLVNIGELLYPSGKPTHE